MTKSSAPVDSSRAASRAAGASTRKTTGGLSAKQIDPALRRAIRIGGGDAPLTVMVKLDTRKSAFGRYPVTNRPGSARERVFNEEVMAEGQSASASGSFRILSTAANLGVATVETSVGIVKDLTRSGKITGMKLKTG